MNLKLSDAEWHQKLTPEQYYVTRSNGTEPPFSHPYCSEVRTGVYSCVCCNKTLFQSCAKFESDSGWPAFCSPDTENVLTEHPEKSWFGTIKEVRCSGCDAHLGHVFENQDNVTGQHYCINGVALTFEESEQ